MFLLNSILNEYVSKKQIFKTKTKKQTRSNNKWPLIFLVGHLSPLCYFVRCCFSRYLRKWSSKSPFSCRNLFAPKDGRLGRVEDWLSWNFQLHKLGLQTGRGRLTVMEFSSSPRVARVRNKIMLNLNSILFFKR